MATVDDKKIIFSMVGVSKIIPQNQKQILKNIYLSFFYGAKIGISLSRYRDGFRDEQHKGRPLI